MKIKKMYSNIKQYDSFILSFFFSSWYYSWLKRQIKKKWNTTQDTWKMKMVKTLKNCLNNYLHEKSITTDYVEKKRKILMFSA